MTPASAYLTASAGTSHLVRQVGAENAEELVFRAAGLLLRAKLGDTKAAIAAVELAREMLGGGDHG